MPTLRDPSPGLVKTSGNVMKRPPRASTAHGKGCEINLSPVNDLLTGTPV